MASSADYVYAGEQFAVRVTGTSNITSGTQGMVIDKLNAVGVVVSSFDLAQPSLLLQIEELDVINEPYQVDLMCSAGIDYSQIADMRYQIQKAFGAVIGGSPAVAVLTADGDPVDPTPATLNTTSSITKGITSTVDAATHGLDNLGAAVKAGMSNLETEAEKLLGATKQTADMIIIGVVVLGVALLATFAFSSDRKVASIVPRL